MIFLLLSLLAFLGLFVGLAVGWLSEEELKAGRPYLEWMRRLLLLAIVIVFFVQNPSALFIIIVSLILISFSFSREREALYYSALGIIFYLSWAYNGFALIAPLIFLYGFSAGSIYLSEHSKEKKARVILGLLLKHLAFLLIGLLFFIAGLVL